MHSCSPPKAVPGNVQAEVPGLSQDLVVSLACPVDVLGGEHCVEVLGRLVEHNLVDQHHRVRHTELLYTEPATLLE